MAMRKIFQIKQTKISARRSFPSFALHPPGCRRKLNSQAIWKIHNFKAQAMMMMMRHREKRRGEGLINGKRQPPSTHYSLSTLWAMAEACCHDNISLSLFFAQTQHGKTQFFHLLLLLRCRRSNGKWFRTPFFALLSAHVVCMFAFCHSLLTFEYTEKEFFRIAEIWMEEKIL